MGWLGSKRGLICAESSGQGTSKQRGRAHCGKFPSETRCCWFWGGVMSHASLSTYSVCWFVVCARARAPDKPDVVRCCPAALVQTALFCVSVDGLCFVIFLRTI